MINMIGYIIGFTFGLVTGWYTLNTLAAWWARAMHGKVRVITFRDPHRRLKNPGGDLAGA